MPTQNSTRTTVNHGCAGFLLYAALAASNRPSSFTVPCSWTRSI